MGKYAMKTGLTKIYILLIVCCFILPSCNRIQFYIDAIHFSNAVINFPQDMIEVQNGEIGICSLNPNIPKLIHYYSSNDCSECALTIVR